MNFKQNNKYFNIAKYTFIVIALSIVFYLLMSRFKGVVSQLKMIASIFTPIIIGFIMAYLFNFLLIFFESNFFKKINIKKATRRFLALVLTYLSILLMFLLFLQFILPQLFSSIVGLVNEIPGQAKEISDLLIDFSKNLKFSSDINNIIMEKFNDFTNYIIIFASNLIPKIGNLTKIIFSRISNIILGLIISIYILIDKETFGAQSRKIISAILPEKGRSKTIELFSRANTIFGNFLSGKILDSFIVGVLTFIVLTLFKMPYTILVSFIIGVSNIIPFFGPFIGAIPAFFIILFISTNKAFLFLIIIFVIQQIDGNIIGPKILGSSLGISPFWILVSLLISGKIFGFFGLVIGVPLFVFIYSIVKDIVEIILEKKGLPVETKAYIKKE